MTSTDPILDQVKTALRAAYGTRLERIVLYGSRARGDAAEDSDYDIAVFLSEMGTNWDEFQTLAQIELDILERTGSAIHAMPYPAGTWANTRAPLMHEIRRDGVDL